jgi:DHA2 family multidrug resistance protein-like MFS transporter
MTSWPIATAIVAPFAGRAADKYGAGIIATIGLIIYSVGLAAYALISNHANVPVIVVIGAICGAGFGTFQSPNNRELMGSGPVEKSGSAAALLATIRVGSQTFGASVVAIVFAAFESHAAAGEPATAFLQMAVPIALAFGCCTAAIAAVVSARRNFKKAAIA